MPVMSRKLFQILMCTTSGCARAALGAAQCDRSLRALQCPMLCKSQLLPSASHRVRSAQLSKPTRRVRVSAFLSVSLLVSVRYTLPIDHDGMLQSSARCTDRVSIGVSECWYNTGSEDSCFWQHYTLCMTHSKRCGPPCTTFDRKRNVLVRAKECNICMRSVKDLNQDLPRSRRRSEDERNCVWC